MENIFMTKINIKKLKKLIVYQDTEFKNFTDLDIFIEEMNKEMNKINKIFEEECTISVQKQEEYFKKFK